MAKKPGSAEQWSTLLLAGTGAVVGVFLATIRHLLHDHSGLTAEEALWHFIPQMLAAMVGGAIVVGGVSAIRNWLKRRS